MIGAYIFVRAADMFNQRKEGHEGFAVLCVLLMIFDSFMMLALLGKGVTS
jgi:hypothetical protein